MTITIIVLLSVAVVVLVVIVAVLTKNSIRQEKELRQKNDVIVHEVRRNQSLINRNIL
jgi:flagellar basal body-associated protein FliL